MKRKKHRINLLQAIMLAVCLFCFWALCYEMVWMPYANQSQAEELKERFPEKTGDPAPEEESPGKGADVQAVDLSALQAQYPMEKTEFSFR